MTLEAGMGSNHGNRLDKGLDPRKFEICVPKKSKLLGDFSNKGIWEDYLKDLKARVKDLREETSDVDLPAETPAAAVAAQVIKPVKCPICVCAGKVNTTPGYKLTGALAIEHARRVHEKIFRQLLRHSFVSAVDVGFGLLEEKEKIANFLAIRIHVTEKLSPRLLHKNGLPNFSNALYGIGDLDSEMSNLLAKGLDWGAGLNAVSALGSDLEKRLQGLAACLQIEVAKLIPMLLYFDFEFPIGGVGKGDRTLQKPPEAATCRLCICGVPLDIIGAAYTPTARHPGGDASEGVFADRPQRSDELQDPELQLIGQGRVTPLVGGVSVGSVNGQAGTLGTVVWDSTDGTPCALSNWHVLAGSASAQVGQPAYQPALFDGGTQEDTIARLKRWHLGEHGDAALAELDGDRLFASGEILGMWNPISGYRRPKLNMKIRKWGRTTGFTEGFIDGLYLATDIDYGGGVVRHFENQFHIAPRKAGQPVSQVGDSGSLVLTSCKPARLEKFRRKICRAFKRKDKKRLEELLTKFCRDKPHRNTPNLNCKNDIKACLEELGFDIEAMTQDTQDRNRRREERVYFAVGMIFAGDTPGSPLGEFAVASDIRVLARVLRFTLRPVYEPRSSFRELRERPPNRRGRGRNDGRVLAPGAPGNDPRGQGPQPDPEPAQLGPGNVGGGS